jgi:uncharacterized protein (DUF885 family)
MSLDIWSQEPEREKRLDYRAFHDVVLGGGSVPLPVLEARVRRWIASEKAES